MKKLKTIIKTISKLYQSGVKTVTVVKLVKLHLAKHLYKATIDQSDYSAKIFTISMYQSNLTNFPRLLRLPVQSNLLSGP